MKIPEDVKAWFRQRAAEGGRSRSRRKRKAAKINVMLAREALRRARARRAKAGHK